MLNMIHAAAMKKDPDNHWFVPETATNMSHPELAALASLELKLANNTTSPQSKITIAHMSTNILRPARKNVIAAATVLAFAFCIRFTNPPIIH